MCYSKEVQLITGSTIVAASAATYYSNSVKFHSKNKPWLRPFLNNVILAFFCIGGHQLFEFLTLQFNNQIVYKIGLILSISSMFFFLRSLEALLNRNLRSKIALAVIAFVAIDIFATQMSFSAYDFYLKHNSAFIWAAAWMLLFIYFHVCALGNMKLLKEDSSKKEVLFYLFATLDASFLLSVAYTLWGYWNYSLNVCVDSPSIWCTFFVLQTLLLPLFLAAVPKMLHSPRSHTVQSIRQTGLYLSLSVIILICFISLLPFFRCLSLKFVFP